MSGGNNGIDLAFRRQNAEYGTSLSMVDDILSLLNRNGDILSSVNIDLIKKEELPTPNEDNLGAIYLYTGPDGEYKHGEFYECVENSDIYSWKNIIVQDSYLKSESDNRFVHKTGDETIDGEKTWNEDAHFEKNITATGNLTIGGTTDITGATTIGDKLTTVGDIILENEENERHIKFKKSNDDAIRGLITNRYVPNSLATLDFTSVYNTGKSASITMLAGEQIKSVVSVMAEKNDAATGDTDIHLRTIATQGWVNNPEKSLNVVHRSGDEKISGRKDFLDDITAPNQLDYTNISNCITEIPQDIKLELNNGVLTLKAGSKIYVPNGFESDGVTRKFDEITIENDLTWLNSDNKKFVIAYDYTNNQLFGNWKENSLSGNYSNVPSNYFGYYYSIDDNLLYDYRNSVRDKKASFPICFITSNTSQITSIDQVFNGFGCIGNKLFVLPGVKGLIPYYWNENGTYKSISFETTEVLVLSDGLEVANKTNEPIRLSGSEITRGALYYNKDLNINTPSSSEPNTFRGFINVGTFSTDANKKITDLNVNTPFRAVDYNDREFIGHQAMPSDRHIDLTLGASGTTYTAPADGWLVLNKKATGVGQEIRLTNNSNGLKGYVISATNNAELGTMVSCSKGDVVYIYYSASGNIEEFRFVYTEGSK